MQFIKNTILVALAFFFGLAPAVHAQGLPTTVPPDLEPGDQYRLIFVTDGTRNGTSTNATDYDTLVQADVAAVPRLKTLGTTWNAAVSTPTQSAVSNTKTHWLFNPSVPVYRLDGVRIADDSNQLWSGPTPGGIQNVVSTTPSGNTYYGQVWSGSSAFGTGAAGAVMGTPAPQTGYSSASNGGWISSSPAANALLLPVYGVSGVLTVPLKHPADLQPGDSYRLLFVTDGKRNAMSANIDDYHIFVRADANAVPELMALRTGFSAVVATTTSPSVTANTQTDPSPPGPTGVPIYRVDGVRIADHYDELWAGSGIQDAVLLTASGQLASIVHASTNVWTGSNPTGWGAQPLGSPQIAMDGDAGSNGFEWISKGSFPATTTELPLYCMSDVIRVPGVNLPPPDLNPGDPYRVVFATDSVRDATSADIADYNAFVNTTANSVSGLQALSSTFTALASTPTVHAKANTQTDPSPAGPTGVPIYRVDGVRIADDYDQLWTVTGPLYAPVEITASGRGVIEAGLGTTAWTGLFAGQELGVPHLTSTVGRLFATNSWWLAANYNVAQTDLKTFYGLSGILRVPGSVSYCTSGVSAGGCQATLSTTGTPSASASSGFDLSAANVEGGKDGLFFYGSNGRQANAWGNGTSYQCVIPPVKRGGLLTGTGNAGACDGSFSQDLNALWASNANKNPGSGTVVQAQLWYRDPLNTSNQTTSLSDAVEFTVVP